MIIYYDLDIFCLLALLALPTPASLFDRRRVCQRSGPSGASFARPCKKQRAEREIKGIKGGGGRGKGSDGVSHTHTHRGEVCTCVCKRET